MTEGAAPIRVMLVDDQELMRTGFRMILEAEDDIEVVAEATNGQEAVDTAPTAGADVVLMDVRMPVLDGIEATSRLMTHGGIRGARVLVLTTFDHDEYVFGALRAGASGFLLKDAPAEDLVAAVRLVAAGDALLAPKITRRLIDEFVQASPKPGSPPAGAEALEALTERENEVLKLMAQGLSNAEIADALFVAETTVKTHVGRVLAKLGLRDRVQAVVLAYESGLVQPGS